MRGTGARKPILLLAHLDVVEAKREDWSFDPFKFLEKGGHSSRPVKDNAIYQLAAGLQRLAAFNFPVNLNEVTRAYFERVSKIEGGQTGAAMKGALQNPPDAKSVAYLGSIPAYNATTRTTCVATMLEAGHAENALPQTARATVNCRILPTETAGAARQTLVRVINDSRITITPT